jgi:hypothetical protein
MLRRTDEDHNHGSSIKRSWSKKLAEPRVRKNHLYRRARSYIYAFREFIFLVLDQYDYSLAEPTGVILAQIVLGEDGKEERR